MRVVSCRDETESSAGKELPIRPGRSTILAGLYRAMDQWLFPFRAVGHGTVRVHLSGKQLREYIDGWRSGVGQSNQPDRSLVLQFGGSYEKTVDYRGCSAFVSVRTGR